MKHGVVVMLVVVVVRYPLIMIPLQSNCLTLDSTRLSSTMGGGGGSVVVVVVWWWCGLSYRL